MIRGIVMDKIGAAVADRVCFVCGTAATFKSGESRFCPDHITEQMKIRVLLERLIELLEGPGRDICAKAVAVGGAATPPISLATGHNPDQPFAGC
jgi:hypothetical protein